MTTMDENPLLARVTELAEEVKKLSKMIERTGFAYRALAISHQALVVELGERTA